MERQMEQELLGDNTHSYSGDVHVLGLMRRG